MSDYRLYNGAPNSELKALWDEEARLEAALLKAEPEAHVTYFPWEGLTQVHVWGKPLSGFHGSRAAAITEAIKNLKDQAQPG